MATRYLFAVLSDTNYPMPHCQKVIRATDTNQAPLRAMDTVLQRMLVDWFSVGFLDLQRISWSSPASYLEQVCAAGVGPSC